MIGQAPRLPASQTKQHFCVPEIITYKLKVLNIRACVVNITEFEDSFGASSVEKILPLRDGDDDDLGQCVTLIKIKQHSIENCQPTRRESLAIYACSFSSLLPNLTGE